MSYKKLFLELFFLTLEMHGEPKCLGAHAQIKQYFANYFRGEAF